MARFRLMPDPDIKASRQPLLPEAGSGGLSLTAVIAVISFLATLALAAFLLVTEAGRDWTRELKAAMTIQVPGDSQDAIDDRTALAVRVLETSEGVTSFRVMPRGEVTDLLAPWLGGADIDAYFSVPAVIEVRADSRLQADLSTLQERLDKAVHGVIVNDHGTWKARLVRSVQSIQILAFSVFVLVMGAACAIAAFAARAGLAANDNVVSLLHLVGATDGYIAGQVQRRFLILGLRGTLAGAIFAVGMLFLISLATRTGAVDTTFIPTFSLTWKLVLILASVPIITCAVTALTARGAAIRGLRKSY